MAVVFKISILQYTDIVNQRELRTDVDSFAEGLRAALREAYEH